MTIAVPISVVFILSLIIGTFSGGMFMVSSNKDDRGLMFISILFFLASWAFMGFGLGKIL